LCTLMHPHSPERPAALGLTDPVPDHDCCPEASFTRDIDLNRHTRVVTFVERALPRAAVNHRRQTRHATRDM
jgi:hypothetical protein